jgi:hypothetical protein
VSDDGVNVFNGNVVQVISDAIDLKLVSQAVAGTDGTRYYLNCTYAGDGSKHLYVYNTLNSKWVEWDIWTGYDVLCYDTNAYNPATHVDTMAKQDILSFVQNNNGLFFITSEQRPTVYQINNADRITPNATDYDNGTLTVIDRLTTVDPGVADTDYKKRTFRDAVNWEAITDFVTNNTVNIKHIKKIQLLADIFKSSDLTISIQYDDSDTWNTIYTKTHTCAASDLGNEIVREKIVITPKKSAHFGYKIKISGIGYAKIYQMEVTLSPGGELYV